MPAKPVLQSKTIWFGALEMAVGILEVLSGGELVLGSTAAGIAATAAGVLTVLLRFVTDRPIDTGQ